MTEYSTPDREVIKLSKTPYQEACTALVAFKLRLIETVAADPRLHGAPCVQVIVVYLSFLTVDKEKLSPGVVYASTMTLMARGGIKSDRTARKARSLLVKYGYLKQTGKTTKDGCAWFEIANPHYDLVSIHVREATEYYKERDADRKKDDRRRKHAASLDVAVDTTSPQMDGDVIFYRDVAVNTTSNYHRSNLGRSLQDRGAPLREKPSFDIYPYAQTKDGDDPNSPLPTPKDDDEAESMMASICSDRHVSAIGRKHMMGMLKDGTLTPRMAERLTDPRKEDAA